MSRKYINLVAAAAMMIGASTAMARPRSAASSSSSTGQSQCSGGKMEKLKAALNQLTDLTTNQKSQINGIMSNAKSSKAAAKSASTTGTASKGEGRELMKQIEGVLTAPQQTKLKQLMKSERRK